MKTTAKRQVYDQEFKRRTLQQVCDGAVLTHVARHAGVTAGMVLRWRRELQTDPLNAFRGNGRRTGSEAEVRRLYEENLRLKAERDLLKKAAAHFAMNLS